MTILVAAALLAPTPAPEKFICSSERFGYAGTVSVYNTLAEARSGRNPRFTSIAFPQRDGSIYMARNMGGEWSEFNAILTNWYSTQNPDPEKKGHGNPNNQNTGFFQMYDNNADNWQNQKAYWSKDKKTFTIESKGKNASYPSVENPGEYARLWNAGQTTGGGEGTKGTYLEYEVVFKASGLTGTDDDNDGFIENTGNATSYSGHFKAIFRNESTRSPESNGFYVVSLTFNNTSWAKGLNLTEVDHFGSVNVAP
jgi:hypothetical protein